MSTVANPEAANEAQAALTNEKAVTKEQKIQEATEAEQKKRKVIDSIHSQTMTVRVNAVPIEMRALTGSEEDWIDDKIAGFSDMVDGDDPEDLEHEEYLEYRESREYIKEMLADKAVEDTFDVEFWGELPQDTRYSVLGDIRSGGQEAREAGGFRSK